MAQATFTGPLIALGGLSGQQRGGSPVEYSNEIGPSMFWNGFGLPNPNGIGSKDRKGQGSIVSLYATTQVISLNAIGGAGGVNLTQAANAAAGVPLPLVTAYAAGIAPQLGLPGGVKGVGIDIGFDTLTTVNGNTTVTLSNPANAWRFWVGQFLCLAGAGAAGAPLFAKVVSQNLAAGTMVLSAAAGASGSFPVGPVFGDPNSYGWQANAYSSLMNAGAGAFFLPDCGIARQLSVAGVAGAAGGQLLIQGFDIYMQPQTELITLAAGAGPTAGKKTWKAIISATPQFTDAHNYTVATTAICGLPIAALRGGIAPVTYTNGVADTAPALVTADLNPPSQTTGDPRGTLALATELDGASVTTIVQTISPAQALSASVLNPAPLFGAAPV